MFDDLGLFVGSNSTSAGILSIGPNEPHEPAQVGDLVVFLCTKSRTHPLSGLEPCPGLAWPAVLSDDVRLGLAVTLVFQVVLKFLIFDVLEREGSLSNYVTRLIPYQVLSFVSL